MGINRDYFHQEWIADLFDNVQFTGTDDIEWRIGEKISERAILYDSEITGRPEDTAEALAVYHCTQVEGPEVGKEAILKIRLQVPPHYPASPKSKFRRWMAMKSPSDMALNEMGFLECLKNMGSTVTAKPLDILQTVQPWKRMPVPDGWMVLIIMEKLPGVPLVDYWRYAPEKREKIRGAFRESLTELYSYGISPSDTHRGNILYDEKENKCWFVDYEDFYKMRNGLRRGFYDDEYVMWNMATRNSKQEVVF